MSEPYIRPFAGDEIDYDSCLQIFYATIHDAINYEPARGIGSYTYCRAYLDMKQEMCFVLDNGSGRAVGYIIGTESTTNLIDEWRRSNFPGLPSAEFMRNMPGEEEAKESDTVKDMMRALHSAECSMLQSRPELLDQYSAHFHIDILPEYQGKGWGPKLMDAFLAKVKGFGAKGVHLGMVASNTGAQRFYERLGFEVCKEVLDGGKSGEVGRDGDALCMVKSL